MRLHGPVPEEVVLNLKLDGRPFCGELVIKLNYYTKCILSFSPETNQSSLHEIFFGTVILNHHAKITLVFNLCMEEISLLDPNCERTI